MQYLTKFRAFQLDTPGSLFSYYKPDEYILIEARLPKGGIDVLISDLAHHDKSFVDVLHITSWDADHCTFNDLVQIINKLRPQKIEVPDYDPESEDGKLCKKVLFEYENIHQKYIHNVHLINQQYIAQLPRAVPGDTTNVLFQSHYNCDNKNDMSLIKLFRSAGFNVLSTGDCESPELSAQLMSYPIIQQEVDVLILAHHGANNGFTTGELLDGIKPKIAICSSNHGNQFEHPRQEVRNLLSARNIPLMTTKTGDILITQNAGSQTAIAVSYESNNTVVQKTVFIIPKQFNILSTIV
jgi:competence protein ComEC